MGGYGALKIGMKHPDDFGVVYAMNPALIAMEADVSPDNPAFAKLPEIKTIEDGSRRTLRNRDYGFRPGVLTESESSTVHSF